MVRAAWSIALLLLVATPAAALAARPAKPEERAAIMSMMRAYAPTVPAFCYPLWITISTRDSRFAAAAYRSTMRCGIVVGNGIYLLRRLSSARWKVVAGGSSFDCRRPLPAAVMRDLLSYC
jgi:hypothetical protein